jgi:NAD(P)-dependent dehydrogenase (short-subunit alcohol dehydrogenase family)
MAIDIKTERELCWSDLSKQAADKTAEITGGSLDVLIGNAARLSDGSGLVTFSQLWAEWHSPIRSRWRPVFARILLEAAELTQGRGSDPEALEAEVMASCKSNIVGTIHLFNLFTPLILKGQIKKVISISTGMVDDELTAEYNIDVNGPYSVTKSGQNTVVAKFSAEYAPKGVLFMSICPGVVDTGHMDPSKSKIEICLWKGLTESLNTDMSE